MKFTLSIREYIDQFNLIIGRIWRSNPSLALLILTGRMLNALLPLGILYTIKKVVDIIAEGNVRIESLLLLTGQFAVLQLAIAIAGQVCSYWENTFQQIVSNSFSKQIIEKSIEIEYTHFEDPAFQNTLYLAQLQARHRINQLLPAIYGALSALLSLVFLVLFFASLNAYFFLAVVLLTIPLSINKWLQGKNTTDLEFKLAPKERESSYLFQLLTGLPWAKEVRTLRYGRNFQQEFSKIRIYISEEKKKIQFNALKNNLFAELFEVIVISSVIIYLAYQSSLQMISIGLFVLYLQGIQRLQSSSKTFLQSILQIFQLRIFVRDLIGYFNLPVVSKENSLKKQLEFEKIEVAHLSFSYPNSIVPIIENINITAKKGEVIAIVGENGSGKSTLVKLLAGLYRPLVGSIRIDDKDIKELSTDEYHKHTAFLFQDYEQYYMEAEKNIHFETSPNEHTSRQAEFAAEKSEAHEFLKQLSAGYKTKLGNMYEGSEELSGGQWQKVALARIFYKDARLLVLDEPSSSLDAIAELKLYEKIRESADERIVILISHRLYNLKIADRIYVMKNGKVIQQGKFQDLTEEDGLFKEMYQKQKI